MCIKSALDEKFHESIDVQLRCDYNSQKNWRSLWGHFGNGMRNRLPHSASFRDPFAPFYFAFPCTNWIHYKPTLSILNLTKDKNSTTIRQYDEIQRKRISQFDESTQLFNEFQSARIYQFKIYSIRGIPKKAAKIKIFESKIKMGFPI